MRVSIVAPGLPGNQVTARRWARMLRSLGHKVRMMERWDNRPADLLIALHALRSRDAVLAFQHAGRPMILGLTGTDVYQAIHESVEAFDTLYRVDRLVALQPAALAELPPDVAARTRVIFQSCPLREHQPAPRDRFAVIVLAAVREVKDPLLCARAVRMLPETSSIQVSHLGRELDPDLVRQLRHESTERYHFLGERPHHETMRRLAHSHMLVLTSRLEGGANVISEAIAANVPVVSTRISGSVGLLGEEYEGYFPVGDHAELSRMLWRAENDPFFYARLGQSVWSRRDLVDPEREREAWRRLIEEVS
ncbi:MAG: selenoneine biosynthesis selenosugar synthase SenB [Candidatus Xenobia bacterium]